MFSKLMKTFTDAFSGKSEQEQKDIFEAVVAGSVYLAYADGVPEESEFNVIKSAIQNNEKLSKFSPELHTVMGRFIKLMEEGPTLGRVKVMQEIQDCSSFSIENKDEIMATLIDVVRKDGRIKDYETVALKEVASNLGADISKFGIE